MQILLIEDDSTLFQELKKELEQWDFNVTGVEDFGNVMDTFEKFNPEIVILDMQLPKYDGFYWCRKMRQESNVPILFLSSRDNPMDQVMSMELGADDFGVEEKRTLSWKDTVVDLSKDSIQKEDKTIFLSKTEMIILEMLINKRNQIVTRDTLITALWDDEAFVSDNTLTVNVNRLRKKLAEIDMDGAIETKVGKGYMAHE